MEGTSIGHTVSQQHSLGPADFQDAPHDRRIDKVMPSLSVSPSVVLFAIRGTGNGLRPFQAVVELATNLCVIVRPLGMLQLAVERGIHHHVAFLQRIVVHCIEAIADHLVGGIAAKQDTRPSCKMSLLARVFHPRAVQVLIGIAGISFLTIRCVAIIIFVTRDCHCSKYQQPNEASIYVCSDVHAYLRISVE